MLCLIALLAEAGQYLKRWKHQDDYKYLANMTVSDSDMGNFTRPHPRG